MTPPVLARRASPGALVIAALCLSGCASLPPDHGLQAVQSLTEPHLPQALTAPAADTAQPDAEHARTLQALVAQPLSADTAVQIALLQSPRWQQGFEALGVAEADRLAASRLPNPSLGFARSRQGDTVTFERSIGFHLIELLAWPVLRDVQQQQLAQARLDTAQAVLRLAHEVRVAWIDAVATHASRVQAERGLDAADAARTLADRMQQAGHWSALRRDQHATFRAEAEQALHAAQAEEVSTRERLTRLLGFARPDAFSLPEHLPRPNTPPAREQGPDGLQPWVQQALDQRLDVRAAKARVEQQARALGLSRSTRVINVLEVEGFNESATDEPRKRGVGVKLELPLFDLGQSRVLQAEARHRQALADTRAVGLDAQSQVREAWRHWQLAEARARQQREEVLPRRQRMAEQLLLRYNGMLASVFDLLADAREQQQAVQQAIALDQAAWAAQSRFELALSTSPGDAPGSLGAPATRRAAPTHD
jgi:outer membrane protein TolC